MVEKKNPQGRLLKQPWLILSGIATLGILCVLNQVVKAQRLAWRLTIRKVTGSNPGKGDNY